MFTSSYWHFCALIAAVPVLDQRVKPVIRREIDHSWLVPGLSLAKEDLTVISYNQIGIKRTFFFSSTSNRGLASSTVSYIKPLPNQRCGHSLRHRHTAPFLG